jgi:Tol biopolymer transport system component
VGLARYGVVLAVVLTATGAAAPGAAVSSAGPYEILYSTAVSEDDECGLIWSVASDSGSTALLDVGFPAACDPDWSPDARHIAFSAGPGSDELRIHVSDEMGRNAVAVSHPPAGTTDFMPAWSPDGTRIVFERRSRDGSAYNLFLVNADGTDERQLTHGRGFDGTPWWSPDGRIVFVSDRAPVRGRCRFCSALYVMRRTDGHVGRITRKEFNALMPAWSPDGVHIAWARAPSIDAPLALYMMRSNTSAARRLDHSGESPAFSPDSHTLAYSSGRGLMLIGVDGSGRRQLTTDGGAGPSWRPVSGAP